MVVRSREGGQVSETVEGNGVLWSRETEGGSVSGDGTRSDIVRSLTTGKETVSTDDGIGGEGRTLEKVGGDSRVKRWLFVDGGEDD